MRNFFFLLLFLPFLATAQELPLWTPKLGALPDVNPAKQQEHEHFMALLEKGEKRSEEENRSLRAYSARGFDERLKDIWQLNIGDCSWYNGGGPEQVKASSALAARHKKLFSAQNAHDLSLMEAWIEGKAGDGIGEWLEYHFKPGSPRISEIKIYNGFVKSEKTWQEHGRVKTLKLYVNGTARAYLQLADTPAEQRFTLPSPWGNELEQKNMELRFEIVAVYGGTKSNHTALTEIFFDGTNVHCFAKGSMVSMANGTNKPIEAIVAGDLVLSYHTIRGEYLAAEVVSTASAVHCNLFRLTFDNGAEITTTPDHPFLLANGTWASFDPVKSRQYLGYEHLRRKTQLGDTFLLVDPTNTQHTTRLVKVEELFQPQPTYTITQLEGGSKTFVVNGVVVGAEDILETTAEQTNIQHD